jgi:sulfite reductase alpha subunit-like flavoprotein
MREKRNVLEVFADFGITSQVPLAYLIQGIGRQKPREFSISSANNGEFCDLTMAVVKYETRLKRQISGVCSGWLSMATPG